MKALQIYVSLLLITLALVCVAHGQTFTDIGAQLEGTRRGTVAWGDYDGDGDLDLAVAGDGSTQVAKIYRNDGGSFTDINAGLVGSWYTCKLAWGDYDRDGDLDLAVTGGMGSSPRTAVYQNTNGVFTAINSGITSVGYSSVAWGDYDGDGDLDIVVAGARSSSSKITRVYRNDAGSFTDINAALVGISEGFLAWGDYDNDGDLDLAVAGHDGTEHRTIIYRNDAGTFVDADAGLPGAYSGQLAWGDYDNDGDLDLALSTSTLIRVYRNDEGTFTNSGTTFELLYSTVAWGDFDNDGDLDLAAAGMLSGQSSSRVSRIYRNDGGTFTDIQAGLIGLYAASIAWGDYDNDGDLDLALTGESANGLTTRIYRNDGAPANTAPTAPTSLSAVVHDGALRFHWDQATDKETPGLGLSYNLRIGTQPGSANIFASMADPLTGRRRIAADGYAHGACSWGMKSLQPATYYWSVQTIDTGLATSPWAAEGSVSPVTISGYVRSAPNSGLAGVSVSANNSGGTGTTNGYGYYSLNVMPGWSGTLTPSKLGYFFDPPSRECVDVLSGLSGQDFVPVRWFQRVETEVQGVTQCKLAWGDYDADGRLDLALIGQAGSESISRIYHNDAGSLVEISAGLTGVHSGGLAWGDYDGDGDLDLALTGMSGETPATMVYRNDGSEFVNTGAPFLNVGAGALAWGDYDNDGDLDLLVAGDSGTQYLTTLYRNEDGAFGDAGAVFVGVKDCCVSWSDYDNDGDLDVIVAGQASTGLVARLYRNDSGIFQDTNSSITGVTRCSAAWSDFDNDGRLDLAISGSTGTTGSSRIYRNDNGTLRAHATLVSLSSSSLAWGDYDGDGDLDLALAGISGSSRVATIYHNQSGVFTQMDAGLPGVSAGAVAWCDFDDDNDLDLAVAGESSNGPIVEIYRNDLGSANTAPTAPMGLSAAATDNGGVAFSWGPSSDAETPATGLTYNLRVGSYPGGDDISPAMADSGSGERQILTTGNAQKKLQWILRNLEPGTLYWSVQAIDPQFQGSPWAPDQELDLAVIQGQVSDLEGSALSGVTVSAGSGQPVAVTDAQGMYRLALPQGWGGTVTPSLVSYVFLPYNRSYTDLTGEYSEQNYTANVSFRLADPTLPNVDKSSLAWGDYDNDGLLDVAIAGDTGAGLISQILRNTGSGFSDINAGLPGTKDGCVVWADYDGDGDLDLALCGSTGTANIASIYRNDSGSFTDISAGLVGVVTNSMAWGDYDNDGDLDLALCGHTGTAYLSAIYRNDDGIFTNANAGIYPVRGAVAWGDYDNDGDLDLLVAGYGGSVSKSIASIYRNDSGRFTDISAGLTPAWNGSAAWGDYDNDGDLDLVLAGSVPPSGNGSVRLYRNDGGIFTYVYALIPASSNPSIAWGDFDNDGDLDLSICSWGQETKVYRNDDGEFVNINAGLGSGGYGSVAWGDYDNDSDLDLVVTGGFSGTRTKLFINCSPIANTAPATPGDLACTLSEGGVTFSWQPSSDTETPEAGLSYNLLVGTHPGGDDVFSGMADTSSGWRRLPALGNTQTRLSWTGKNLPGGIYYWSVQAIDSAFAGSAWAPEQSVGIVSISGHVRTADGGAVPGATIRADGPDAWTISDSTGCYHLTVPEGWSGTVSAAKPGFFLDPRSRSYANVFTSISDQDYLAATWFHQITPGLPGLQDTYPSDIAWGDYDQDGDMDLVLAGGIYGAPPISRIYRNENGAFTDIVADLVGVRASTLAWGDYDNDGDLDLLLSGNTGITSSTYVTKIYRNDAGSFVDTNANLLGLNGGAAVWGDYDNDGDLDIVLGGYSSGSSRNTRLYRNDSGTFIEISTGLIQLESPAFAWGDYDNDGDLDLAAAGTYLNNHQTRIYQNDAGTFVDINAGLLGVYFGCLAWGDYDNDGDLDLAVSGSLGAGRYASRIYRNDAGRFTNIVAGLEEIGGQLCWGDYDNDGDLDLLSVGATGTGQKSRIYCNEAGIFLSVDANLVGGAGSATWADYDGDGDLDLAFIGVAGTTTAPPVFYRNDCDVPNTPPTAPTNLSVVLEADKSVFSWNSATDAETPSKGLSYNLRVGTSPGKGDVFSGMADAETGFRYLPAVGNAQKMLSWALSGLSAERYYWSVQAIDTALAGSPWAPEYGGVLLSISGYVRTTAGDGIPGAVVAADYGGTAATTDASGFYSIRVPQGWDGNVAVTRPTYSFTPPSRSYQNVIDHQMNQDFVGTGGFTRLDAGLQGTGGGCLAWGDYDNDSDLDLAIAGGSGARVYRNDGGGRFTDSQAGLTAGSQSSIAWGDYDRDGDLDLAVSGEFVETTVYRNDEGTFTDTKPRLPVANYGCVAWGDYDNDGDLDLAVLGSASGSYVTSIYRNTNGQFSDINAGLVRIWCGAAAWGDYDKDGDLDLVVTGVNYNSLGSEEPHTILYRNDGGHFSDVGAGLVQLARSAVAWADYDNDGDLDLALAGSTDASYVTKIYRNDDGQFIDIGADLLGVRYCSLSWGDFDNDGDPDLAVVGQRSTTGQPVGSARIYRNEGGVFQDIVAGLPDLYQASVAWGDYDGDRDLDLAIHGYTGTGFAAYIYRNDSAAFNATPTPPTDLSASSASGGLVFSWNSATDAETPSNGLSYNLRVGTSPGKGDVFSGMADAATGFRYLPAVGNAQKMLSWELSCLPTERYYWSVQTIDTALAGSPWAPEQAAVFGTMTAAGAKLQLDGTEITCGPVVVTAIFDDCIYVESTDRSCGIRASKPEDSVEVGMLVEIAGIMRTVAGERSIETRSIVELGESGIEPYLILNKDLGGWGWNFVESSSTGQRGVEGGVGLANIGLLVKIVGRVSATGDDFFYVDDGSGANDGSIFNGVRVRCGSLWKPEAGQMVSVTGISTIMNVGGRYFRSIRPRTDADILVLK